MGAACVRIAPQASGLNRNGLRSNTWFYPGILLREECDGLPDPAGWLGRDLDGLRAALRTSLGIGCGSCLHRDAPAGSRRGRIVEVQPNAASYLGTRYSVVLTEPAYSRARNYDVILPIRPGDGYVGSEGVVRIGSREWLAVFAQPPQSVLLPIPVVQSLWYASSILHDTQFVMDDDSLAEIDRALCGYFSLPEG